MDPSAHPSTSVSAIFARAERVFERRVDQLLQLKRVKARAAGTTFNARKAKRDARTVAGREKLDALVRRLADLATLQEKALGKDKASLVVKALDSAATAVVGVAAMEVMTKLEGFEIEGEECGGCENEDGVGGGKDILDTSSCSDDCSVGGGLVAMKDFIREEECVGEGDKEGTIFPATESVVNFVLECEDEECFESNRDDYRGRLVASAGVHSGEWIAGKGYCAPPGSMI